MARNMEEQVYSNLRVQCFNCGRWCDAREVSVDLSDYIPYMCNYEFTGDCCGEEVIAKKTASFLQIAITAIANLTASAKANNLDKVYFSADTEIIPFIEGKWDIICTHRSKSATWKQKLYSKLTSEQRIFCCSDIDSHSPFFGLVDQDLSTVGPKRYQSKPVIAKGPAKSKSSDVTGEGPPAKKGKTNDVLFAKLLSHGYPTDHPFNKDGFRYIYSEQDPHATMDFDPEDLAGKPIPSELYRPVVHDQVLLSLNDRAPQLKVSEDRLSVTGDKGYCMIRATHGVSKGTWYFEVYVKDIPQPDCAVRLGWAQVYGNLQAPCGFDKFSYSWRSKKGTIFHHSRGKHFSAEGFTKGDTLGVLIHLPSMDTRTGALPITHKDEALIKFKSFFYFEHKDTPVAEAEQHLQCSKGSKIAFYKNGECKGTAFSDIYSGTYYPTISLYKNAEVSVNFGPNFKFLPPVSNCKPMSSCGVKMAVEQTMAEMLFHVTRRPLLDR